MPRLFTSQNNPLDFCIIHFPSESKAQNEYGNLGDGPDGRGNCFSHNTEHPPYSSDNYRCEVCGKILEDDDN